MMQLKHTEVYQNIPLFKDGVWSHISFSSREEFTLELESKYFKEPGEYGFDKLTEEWNKELREIGVSL